MEEKKNITKLDLAKAICGTIAACGAYSIVICGIGSLKIQPRSKMHKWIMKYGAYALGSAAGMAAYKAIEQDFDSIKSLLGIKDAIKKGIDEAKAKAEEEPEESEEDEDGETEE